jgi:hypothetical protein
MAFLWLPAALFSGGLDRVVLRRNCRVGIIDKVLGEIVWGQPAVGLGAGQAFSMVDTPRN